jgi:guanylate kinase
MIIMKNNMGDYIIQFDHYEPGCGCGCEKNDLNIADQNIHKIFYFSGTKKQANQELERLQLNMKGPSYGNHWSLEKQENNLKPVAILGPSGVGKTPLEKMIRKHLSSYLDELRIIKSYESRDYKCRPNEKDIWENPDYFQTEKNILKLKNNSEYLVAYCRGFPQAINLTQFAENPKKKLGDVYHTFIEPMKNNEYLKENDIEFKTIFISPVDMSEINNWKHHGWDVSVMLEGIMLDKLHKRKFDEDDLSRARGAIDELKQAYKCDYVAVNPYGEGHPFFVRWNETEIGTIAASINDLIWKDYRQGNLPYRVQRWGEDLIN